MSEDDGETADDAETADDDAETSTDRAGTALAAARAGGAVALEYYREDLAVERKAHKTDLVTRADREAEATVLEELRASGPDVPVVAEESASATAVPDSGPAWVVDPIDGTNNFVRGIPLWATAVAALSDGEPVAAAVIRPAVGDAYVAGDDGTRRGPVSLDGSGDAAAIEGTDAASPSIAASFDGDPVGVSDRRDPETMVLAPTIWWGRSRWEEYLTAAEAVGERFGDFARFRSAQVTLAMVADGALDATFTNRTPNSWDSVAGAHLVDRAGGTVTDVHGDPWRHDAHGLVASNGRRHEAVCAVARAVADVAHER